MDLSNIQANQYVRKIQEFILFTILRLKRHPNNVGVHFVLPIRPFQLFGINLYLIRLNFVFPFFVSFSAGFEGRKGFQIYTGLKMTESEWLEWGEYDYMISFAARYHTLAFDRKWKNMGAL